MIRYIEKQSDNARVRMLGYVWNCTQEYIYIKHENMIGC